MLFSSKLIKAGKMTNEEEIERMLESGNPQIFTEGVSVNKMIEFRQMVLVVVYK